VANRALANEIAEFYRNLVNEAMVNLSTEFSSMHSLWELVLWDEPQRLLSKLEDNNITEIGYGVGAFGGMFAGFGAGGAAAAGVEFTLLGGVAAAGGGLVLRAVGLAAGAGLVVLAVSAGHNVRSKLGLWTFAEAEDAIFAAVVEQVNAISTAWENHTTESFNKQMNNNLLKRTRQEYSKEDARRKNPLDDRENAVSTSRTAEAEFMKLEVDARFKKIEQEVKSLTSGVGIGSVARLNIARTQQRGFQRGRMGECLHERSHL
jgi:hypothetical protein